jgi:uncharacterized protein YgiM (DUF1202 family)
MRAEAFVLSATIASLSTSVTAADTRESQAAAHNAPIQQTDGCMSLDSYNKASAEATARTDWSRVPDGERIPQGTRSLMGEFVVYKEMRRNRTPPCPDLASAHAEVRVALSPPTAGAPSAASPVRQPTESQPVSTPQSAVVNQDANIREEPSGEARIVRTAKAGERLAVFYTKYGWSHVGRQSPEGWIGDVLLTR